MCVPPLKAFNYQFLLFFKCKPYNFNKKCDTLPFSLMLWFEFSGSIFVKMEIKGKFDKKKLECWNSNFEFFLNLDNSLGSRELRAWLEGKNWFDEIKQILFQKILLSEQQFVNSDVLNVTITTMQCRSFGSVCNCVMIWETR